MKKQKFVVGDKITLDLSNTSVHIALENAYAEYHNTHFQGEKPFRSGFIYEVSDVSSDGVYIKINGFSHYSQFATEHFRHASLTLNREQLL